jgi:hypothetical protein
MDKAFLAVVISSTLLLLAAAGLFVLMTREEADQIQAPTLSIIRQQRR